ncbi:MAG: membrane dipeptidase [Pseudomonadota bacterium]
MRHVISAVVTGLVLTACAPPVSETTGSQTVPAKLETQLEPSDFHNSIMVFDSHLDTPALFHSEDYKFSDRQSWEKDGSQVDYPRMIEGGLDGGFWVIYTRQGLLDEDGYRIARTNGIMRQASIRELAAKYHDKVELAFTADDADRIVDEGKIAIFQSMENAYPFGEDVSMLETFYVGGLRMLGPVHFSNNQFADSSTDTEVWYDGLSPLGEELVREANRLGIVLDGSHASDAATRDMIALSTTPIILSHTSTKAIYDHPRNIDDELLLELAESGGVIQMNIFGGYLEQLAPNPERAAAIAELSEKYGSSSRLMDEATYQAWDAEYDVINAAYPRSRSTYEKFMEHTFHVLSVVGPDHVGISGDFDGGGGVDGMSDISMIPRITSDLLAAGYSEEDIQKIWSGNMLRLLRQAEAARTSTLTSPDVVN